jgi:peptidoglycan/LPS O-acetylase OafA/YrhL
LNQRFLFTPGLHPAYAIGSIATLALLADGLRRAIPFFRREINSEAAARLTPLDGLRGILCFGVMYHHAAITHAFLRTGVWEETPSVFYVLLGQTSVALFFCITAFLFWGRTLDRKGDIAPLVFLRNRLFRIAPLYWFTCAAAVFISRRQIHFSRHSTWLALGKMALPGLCSWSNIGKVDINMVNSGVTWTLQYEWVFYLALPAMALLVRAGHARRIAFLALAWWIMNGIDRNVDYKAFFLTGIFAAHLSRMPRLAEVLRNWMITLLTLAILISMPLLLRGGYGWLPLLLTSLVFIPIACGNSLFGILNYPGLRMMGLISYSVYLLHGMFLFTARPLLHQALLRGEMQYWLAVSGCGVAALLCCSITYRLIEWPMIRLEKRFARLPA